MCPNCNGRTSLEGRCGRPTLRTAAYFDDLESIASQVVGAGFDEYGDDLRAPAADGSELMRAIVRLADRIKHYHYDGDGCLDDDDDDDEEEDDIT